MIGDMISLISDIISKYNDSNMYIFIYISDEMV